MAQILIFVSTSRTNDLLGAKPTGHTSSHLPRLWVMEAPLYVHTELGI